MSKPQKHYLYTIYGMFYLDIFNIFVMLLLEL